jgi:hypothetical protein
MEADGFLMLGAVETVVGLTDIFRPFPDKRGLYRPSGVRRRSDVLKVAALQPRRLFRSGGDRRISFCKAGSARGRISAMPCQRRPAR